MVIIEICAADVDKIMLISESAKPGALASGSTTVIFVPTERNVLPVKDPKKGWILPLSDETTHKLTATPGDYEINPQIARSEERRVGKECRYRGSRSHYST